MSGSETGSEEQGPRPRGGGGGPAGGDLASRTLVLESKRFYLDVKENTRGRFIKIAEISADGRKNQILMTLPTAAQFRQHLVAMIEFYEELEPVDPDHLVQGELRSEVMFKEDKKYHVDLKENGRGRLLKVTETDHTKKRFTIVIPADGMRAFEKSFKEILEEFYEVLSQESLESRSLRIQNKTFYFDHKSNSRGSFLKISEVSNRIRCDIQIPESGWSEFAKVVDMFERSLNEVLSQECLESRSLRIQNKTFYFDHKSNSRGSFLKISEVSNSIRCDIQITESGWSEFAKVVDMFAKKQPTT